MDLRNSTPLFKSAYKFNEKDSPQERVRKLNELARQLENRLNELERKVVENDNGLRKLAG